MTAAISSAQSTHHVAQAPTLTEQCKTETPQEVLEAIKQGKPFDQNTLTEACKRLQAARQKCGSFDPSSEEYVSHDVAAVFYSWQHVVHTLIEKDAPITDEALSLAHILGHGLYEKMQKALTTPSALSLTEICNARTYKEASKAIKQGSKPFDENTLTEACKRAQHALEECGPIGPAYGYPDVTPPVRFLKWEKIVHTLIKKDAPITDEALEYAKKIKRDLPEMMQQKQKSIRTRVIKLGKQIHTLANDTRTQVKKICLEKRAAWNKKATEFNASCKHKLGQMAGFLPNIIFRNHSK